MTESEWKKAALNTSSSSTTSQTNKKQLNTNVNSNQDSTANSSSNVTNNLNPVTTVNPRERPKAANLNAINPIIPLVPSSSAISNSQRSGQPPTQQLNNANKITVSIKPPPANQTAFSPTLNQQQQPLQPQPATSFGFDDDFNSINSNSLNTNNDLQFVNQQQQQQPQQNIKLHQLLTASNSSPIQTSNYYQFSSNERINQHHHQQHQLPFTNQQTPVIANIADKKSHRRSASQ